jgi:hypothetical protein
MLHLSDCWGAHPRVVADEAFFLIAPAGYLIAWPPADGPTETITQMDEQWIRYTANHEGESLLVGDENHSPSPSLSPFAVHRGIGVYINGNVRTFNKAGDITSIEWWN